VKLQNYTVNPNGASKKNGSDAVTLPVKVKKIIGDRVCFSSNAPVKKEEKPFKSALKSFAVAFGSISNQIAKKDENPALNSKMLDYSATVGLNKFKKMTRSKDFWPIKQSVNKDNELYVDKLANMTRDNKINLFQMPEVI